MSSWYIIYTENDKGIEGDPYDKMISQINALLFITNWKQSP